MPGEPSTILVAGALGNLGWKVLATLFERALSADGDEWPEGFVIVNGMSRNRGMRWSLEDGRRWLRCEPADVHATRGRAR